MDGPRCQGLHASEEMTKRSLSRTQHDEPAAGGDGDGEGKGHHGCREYCSSEKQFKLNAALPNTVRADGTLPVRELLDTSNPLPVPV